MAEAPCDTGEGTQLQILRVLLRKAVEDISNTFQNDGMSRLSDVPNLKQHKARGIIEAFKRSFSKAALQDFDHIIEVEEFDKKLRAREELIHQQMQSEGSVAWRPSGSVSEDVRSHEMEVLKSRIKQLSRLTEIKEDQVSDLFEKVQEARSKASNLEMRLAEAQLHMNKLQQCTQKQQEVHKSLTKTLASGLLK